MQVLKRRKIKNLCMHFAIIILFNNSYHRQNLSKTEIESLELVYKLCSTICMLGTVLNYFKNAEGGKFVARNLSHIYGIRYHSINVDRFIYRSYF